MVKYITLSESKKRNKGKNNYYIKGYFDGYNNPARSTLEVNKIIKSGKLNSLSQKTKDFIEGKSRGVIEKKKI